jgi:hypothetical protein
MEKKDLKQYLKPITPIKNLPSGVVLGEAVSEHQSPEFTAFMGCVAELLKELAPEAFDKTWTRSLFPERISQAGLRICEQHAAQQTAALTAQLEKSNSDKEKLGELLKQLYDNQIANVECYKEDGMTTRADIHQESADRIKSLLTDCGITI